MSDPPSVEGFAAALAAAVNAALPGWVTRVVDQRYRAWCGRPPPPAVGEAAVEAGRRAQGEVGGRVGRLLEADIDDQWTTPLTLLREAVAYPTAVLRGAGVPEARRDAMAREMFPDDAYDLTPASFGDIDPSLQEPGLQWGAAKAWTHQQRHGSGRR